VLLFTLHYLFERNHNPSVIGSSLVAAMSFFSFQRPGLASLLFYIPQWNLCALSVLVHGWCSKGQSDVVNSIEVSDKTKTAIALISSKDSALIPVTSINSDVSVSSLDEVKSIP